MDRINTDSLEKAISLLKTSQDLIKDLQLLQQLQKEPRDQEALEQFLRQPYLLLPRKKDEWYVIVPRFVNFHVGWLHKTTSSYNIFLLNRYITWLTPLPSPFRDLFVAHPLETVRVTNHILTTAPEARDNVWKAYRPYLTKRKSPSEIYIRPDYEFQLIANLIRDGYLPFVPRPVDKKDLRHPQSQIKLRDYQQNAWITFLQYGAIGTFWAFGTGKTFLGLYALNQIRGPKLVVVPTRLLKEQWQERINTYLPMHSEEVQLITYHAYPKVANHAYNLTIFDECHALPANTYSRLATINTKYRIGLSATPYREDQRTDLIFALTGKPIGMDLDKMYSEGIVQKPVVYLYLVDSQDQKKQVLSQLLEETKRTLIYCDAITTGKHLEEAFKIPFVYGKTTNRLETIKEHQIVIVSRIADEGISLDDLERVIEYDFLYGSRRQEGQRLGRLFHATAKGEHYILMTDKELERYEKRLMAIYDKGLTIQVLRG